MCSRVYERVDANSLILVLRVLGMCERATQQKLAKQEPRCAE
jgi:hypothetical protein